MLKQFLDQVPTGLFCSILVTMFELLMFVAQGRMYPLWEIGLLFLGNIIIMTFGLVFMERRRNRPKAYLDSDQKGGR